MAKQMLWGSSSIREYKRLFDRSLLNEVDYSKLVVLRYYLLRQAYAHTEGWIIFIYI